MALLNQFLPHGFIAYLGRASHLAFWVGGRAREAGALVVLIQQESLDGPLDYGTPGWQLATGLDTAASDALVRKRAPERRRFLPAR